MFSHPIKLFFVVACVLLGFAFPAMAMAQVVVNDGCADAGGGAADIDTVTASFDDITGDITVVVTLCAPAADKTKYRVHFDHTVQCLADLLQEFTKLIGLRQGPWKAVKNKAATVPGGQFFLDQANDNFIRHQIAPVHHVSDNFAHCSARCARLAQHVARRDVQQPILLGSELRLRALAGADQPQQHHLHRRAAPVTR